MKKSILGIVLILIGLVFYFAATTCIATPVTVSMSGSVNSNHFEMIMKKQEYPKHNLLLSPENNETQELAIDNCVQKPSLDKNKNGVCVRYELDITYKIPSEGAIFYSIYYLRTKQKGGEWGEWGERFIGATRFWSQEDGENLFIKFFEYLLVEDGDIPPSVAQFKVETYTDSNVLKSIFETSSNKRKYWFPALIESDNYDLEDSS